jgi:hypothetical protein
MDFHPQELQEFIYQLDRLREHLSLLLLEIGFLPNQSDEEIDIPEEYFVDNEIIASPEVGPPGQILTLVR